MAECARRVLEALRAIVQQETVPPELIGQLKADVAELREMTPEQCAAFRAAAGAHFQYSIGSPHFSSGHKAACCLGRQVLGWLDHGRLSDEDRAALATCTSELGIRLERERAVVRTIGAGQIAPNRPAAVKHAAGRSSAWSPR
jgi:hypothetical protein